MTWPIWLRWAWLPFGMCLFVLALPVFLVWNIGQLGGMLIHGESYAEKEWPVMDGLPLFVLAPWHWPQRKGADNGCDDHHTDAACLAAEAAAKAEDEAYYAAHPDERPKPKGVSK